MTDIGNVLIVGASASVGAEIVGEYAKASMNVIATYHSHRPEASASNVIHSELDLLSASSRSELIGFLSRDAGGIDVAVFVAGIIMGQPLAKYTDEQADSVMSLNFTAQAMVIRDLLPLMNDGSQMLLLGSIASERGSFDPIYAASKGALIPFGKSLATAHGEKMSVNVVLPGPIESSTMFDDMSPQTQARHRSQSPRKKLLSRGDLARILVDMSRPHWRHVNGAVIRVNGASYV